ncbi:hypothetical protein ACHAXS_004147 [Conticribra weissflogii]
MKFLKKKHRSANGDEVASIPSKRSIATHVSGRSSLAKRLTKNFVYHTRKSHNEVKPAVKHEIPTTVIDDGTNEFVNGALYDGRDDNEVDRYEYKGKVEQGDTSIKSDYAIEGTSSKNTTSADNLDNGAATEREESPVPVKSTESDESGNITNTDYGDALGGDATPASKPTTVSRANSPSLSSIATNSTQSIKSHSSVKSSSSSKSPGSAKSCPSSPVHPQTDLVGKTSSDVSSSEKAGDNVNENVPSMFDALLGSFSFGKARPSCDSGSTAIEGSVNETSKAQQHHSNVPNELKKEDRRVCVSSEDVNEELVRAGPTVNLVENIVANDLICSKGNSHSSTNIVKTSALQENEVSIKRDENLKNTVNEVGNGLKEKTSPKRIFSKGPSSAPSENEVTVSISNENTDAVATKISGCELMKKVDSNVSVGSKRSNHSGRDRKKKLTLKEEPKSNKSCESTTESRSLEEKTVCAVNELEDERVFAPFSLLATRKVDPSVSTKMLRASTSGTKNSLSNEDEHTATSIKRNSCVESNNQVNLKPARVDGDATKVGQENVSTPLIAEVERMAESTFSKRSIEGSVKSNSTVKKTASNGEECRNESMNLNSTGSECHNSKQAESCTTKEKDTVDTLIVAEEVEVQYAPTLSIDCFDQDTEQVPSAEMVKVAEGELETASSTHYTMKFVVSDLSTQSNPSNSNRAKKVVSKCERNLKSDETMNNVVPKSPTDIKPAVVNGLPTEVREKSNEITLVQNHLKNVVLKATKSGHEDVSIFHCNEVSKVEENSFHSRKSLKLTGSKCKDQPSCPHRSANVSHLSVASKDRISPDSIDIPLGNEDYVLTKAPIEIEQLSPSHFEAESEKSKLWEHFDVPKAETMEPTPASSSLPPLGKEQEILHASNDDQNLKADVQCKRSPKSRLPKFLRRKKKAKKVTSDSFEKSVGQEISNEDDTNGDVVIDEGDEVATKAEKVGATIPDEVVNPSKMDRVEKKQGYGMIKRGELREGGSSPVTDSLTSTEMLESRSLSSSYPSEGFNDSKEGKDTLSTAEESIDDTGRNLFVSSFHEGLKTIARISSGVSQAADVVGDIAARLTEGDEEGTAYTSKTSWSAPARKPRSVDNGELDESRCGLLLGCHDIFMAAGKAVHGCVGDPDDETKDFLRGVCAAVECSAKLEGDDLRV